jgi:hypothetical protein
MVEAIKENRLKTVATEVPFLRHMFSQAEGISEMIEQLDWQVLIAPPSVGFIICDNPAVVVPPQGCASIGILIPGTVKYFPLTRQYCLRLGSSRHSFSYRKISTETVQVVNRNIAANSERFVMGPDRAQLLSTIKHSGSIEHDSTPRFTVETLNADDHGSFQKLTRRPTRYFYLKGNLRCEKRNGYFLNLKTSLFRSPNVARSRFWCFCWVIFGRLRVPLALPKSVGITSNVEIPCFD